VHQRRQSCSNVPRGPTRPQAPHIFDLMAVDPAIDVAAAIANAAFSDRLRRSWCRDCDEGIEVLPCQDPSRGNGLFARRSFQDGEVILEEDPVSGLAMLLGDEAKSEKNCAHCTLQLQGGAVMPVPCRRACGVVYCSEACRDAAWWAHHEVLCAASNEAWAAFEAHAYECANEYYVLAARALATLRHDQDDADRSSSDDVWSALPWAGYASRPWWETMRRPSYGGSSSSSSGCVSDGGDRERDKVETRNSDGCSEEALDSNGESSDSSLDRFFISKVREQTAETVTMLRAALAQGGLPQGGLANTMLCSDAEGFGRLVGLLRVNALTVQAAKSDTSTAVLGNETQTGNVVKGLAIYAVTSAMNHMTSANCYVASNPQLPQHCLVCTSRRIEPGEELCINYLEGAPFDAEQRHGILKWQYGIP